MEVASDRIQAVVRWYRDRHPEATRVTVHVEDAPAGGYSNELLFVTVRTVDGEGIAADEGLVLRFAPAGPSLFPAYDLSMQVAVQAFAGGVGVPVAPVELVGAEWFGREALAMPHVRGRHPGEAPALTPWVAEAATDEQRRLHTGFLDALAALHRAPWAGTGIESRLRGAGATLADEVAWWEGFANWACEGASSDTLLGLFGWCRDRLPAPVDEPLPSVLWGDVRLGNVVVDDAFATVAVLDWEMATIGPAESDVAWFTALSDMTDHFVGSRAPGFLDRAGVVAHHEAALGRPLRDLEWHEAFAMARAVACHIRTQFAQAEATGTEAPDPARHGVVRYAQRFMQSLG